MLKIEKEKLPKEYERIILEEYYNFFSYLYGYHKEFCLTKPHFTLDTKKIRKNDWKDVCFVETLNAYKSINEDNVQFILYEEDDIITALARLVVLPNERIHLTEVIFLNYQTYEEKELIMKQLLEYFQTYGAYLECQKAYFEIPRFYPEFISLAIDYGYDFIDESVSKTDRNVTYLMEKELTFKRNQDEPTRRREQTN